MASSYPPSTQRRSRRGWKRSTAGANLPAGWGEAAAVTAPARAHGRPMRPRACCAPVRGRARRIIASGGCMNVLHVMQTVDPAYGGPVEVLIRSNPACGGDWVIRARSSRSICPATRGPPTAPSAFMRWALRRAPLEAPGSVPALRLRPAAGALALAACRSLRRSDRSRPVELYRARCPPRAAFSRDALLRLHPWHARSLVQDELPR